MGHIEKRLADLAMLEAVPRPVVGAAHDYGAGDLVPPHSHGRHQLVYASEGVMTVSADAGTWLVPPERAVWMPAGIVHRIRMQGPVAMRSLYFAPDEVPDPFARGSVVDVPVLLRELILAVVALPNDYDPAGPGGRLVAVLLDQVRALKAAPLHLPRPRDARLRRIADGLAEDPADGRTLEHWAQIVGASRRTLARRFRQETGMSFRDWRARLRLLWALERLAAHASVTDVALDLGYESPSAFIHMFRKTFGTTP